MKIEVKDFKKNCRLLLLSPKEQFLMIKNTLRFQREND